MSVDTVLSNRGVNPSIGEMSIGMSTSISMGSGSHLDRLAAADRENASIAACAGSIASGNISLGINQKSDFQHDGSSNKRFSLSSHSETASATLSFGERSVNISLMDDASVKALAGSIGGCREVNYTSGIAPVEVHVDGGSTSQSKMKEDNYQYSYLLEPASLDPQSINVTLNDYYVNDYDETTSPDGSDKIEKGSMINDTQRDLIGKQNSFNKYESRSLEHLSNYCEICHKTHKPCCPNLYSHQNNNSNKFQSSRSASSSASHSASNTNKKSKIKSPNCPSNDQEQQRKLKRQGYFKAINLTKHSSIKPNQPNSSSNDNNEIDIHKKLKRVKSSEYYVGSKSELKEQKRNHISQFKSTPTSPIDSEINFNNMIKTKPTHQTSLTSASSSLSSSKSLKKQNSFKQNSKFNNSDSNSIEKFIKSSEV